MSVMAQFVGGPCDGRLEGFPEPTPRSVTVPQLRSRGYVKEWVLPEVCPIKDLVYLKRFNAEGSLLYVWDRLIDA